MFLLDLDAACAIKSIAKGASIVLVWPVSRFENRSTSLSNRTFISSTDDFCSIGILTLAFYFSEDIVYLEKAKDVVETWFINNDTKMNPNVDY